MRVSTISWRCSSRHTHSISSVLPSQSDLVHDAWSYASCSMPYGNVTCCGARCVFCVPSGGHIRPLHMGMLCTLLHAAICMLHSVSCRVDISHDCFISQTKDLHASGALERAELHSELLAVKSRYEEEALATSQQALASLYLPEYCGYGTSRRRPHDCRRQARALRGVYCALLGSAQMPSQPICARRCSACAACGYDALEPLHLSTRFVRLARAATTENSR